MFLIVVVCFALEHESGDTCRYKTRLVPKGFAQMYRTDYSETFCFVVRQDSVRILISIAVNCGTLFNQFHIGTAFLNGKFDEVIFMRQQVSLALPDSIREPQTKLSGCDYYHKLFTIQQCSVSVEKSILAWDMSSIRIFPE